MSKKSLLLLISVFVAACQQQRITYPRYMTIVQTVYASGKVMADSEYTVGALISGTVIGKLVKEGDQIKKGQVIYILRHTAPAAKMEAAASALLNARENISARSRILNDLKIAEQNADLKFHNDSLLYIRYQNLWAQNIGTRVNLDNAQTQYELSYNQKQSAREKYRSTLNDLKVSMKNAESMAAGSRADLENYFIRAESSGTIYQLLKEKGEAVKMNEPVALLGRSGTRLIQLAVDQEDIRQIRAGQQVLLKTDASGEHIYQAKISRIYPMMNETDQTFRVDALFTDGADPAYLHSSVEANIIIAKKMNCLTIPLALLMTGDSIRVRQNGRIVTQPVKTGIRTTNEIEIISGASRHTAILDPFNPQ
ncbi:efflux RND transporter periplasmic adaptor subunit [Mucilaginibacter sp. AK015]|uniref:efflux RND transporter periplasmic adaptor subunit n=1 Tax=Mucilaginibacter sp. AK015 TaxID=2723072 RepID=UPI00161AE40D|nr:HlyD family efflux transporter periplasmic adaptor subunit [Mucilaginibacter sp. AK015]MBB5396869.1 multidrug efflux pump subunit AcrA (membrane-fusion protein) [Mucilaginibacter sp. AK015]